MAKNSLPSKWFIFSWLLATLAGMLAAFVVLLPLLLSVDYVGDGNAFLYLGLIATFALAGALIGTAQWLVLRRNSAITAAWIGATAAGLALAALVIALLDPLPQVVSQELAAIVLIPLAISAVQIWALRGKVIQPWAWLAVTYLAFIVFFGLFVFADRSALVSAGIYLSYPLISGIGMWWLLGRGGVAAVRPKRTATKLPLKKKR
jgi:hypothetical protein